MFCLLYSEQQSGSSTGMSYYSYRANSIYDPNYSGVGHQPRGYDELAPFYRKYEVVRSAIQITISVPDSSVDRDETLGVAYTYNAPMRFWITCSNTTSGPSSATACEESPRTVAVTCGTGQTRKLRYSTTIRPLVPDPDDRITPYALNPSGTCMYHICHEPTVAATAVQYNYTVKIWYYVRMSDPITIPES